MFGRARKVSVIVAPHGSSRSWSRDLSLPVLVGIGFALLVLFVLLLFLLVQVVDLSARARDAVRLAAENAQLRQQVGHVENLESELSELREFETRIRRWAGIDAGRTRTTRGADVCQHRWEREETLLAEIPTAPPVRGWVSRGFEAGAEGHMGMDFAGETGTPVLASALGIVRLADRDEVFGNLVVLDHGNGFTSWYGHNDTLLVQLGDLVPRGQPVATLGNTGRSSAPHVHFEVRLDEEPLDPAFLLSDKDGGA
jgi:murein DD-endopeptidase MepM/ murein hydrolase activator NlpD